MPGLQWANGLSRGRASRLSGRLQVGSPCLSSHTQFLLRKGHRDLEDIISDTVCLLLVKQTANPSACSGELMPSFVTSQRGKAPAPLLTD